MFMKPITKLHRAILLLIVFSAFLPLLRVQLTQSLNYSFLLWNMFLAVIPFIFGEYAKRLDIEKTKKYQFVLLTFGWLFFLPNAPYIVTDFIHFKPNGGMAWYDLFMLFVNASTGMLLGLLSIVSFYDIISKKWGRRFGQHFSVITFFLCGFGIYLGRFLRFNSWDVVFSPLELIKKSLLSFQESTAWYVTFGFGFLLWMLFSVVKESKIRL